MGGRRKCPESSSTLSPKRLRLEVPEEGSSRSSRASSPSSNSSEMSAVQEWKEMEEWRKRVNEEYIKIFAGEKHELQANLAKDDSILLKNRKRMAECRKYKLDKKPVKFKMMPGGNKTNKGARTAQMLTVATAKKLDGQKVSSMTLPDVKRIPVMYAWATTQFNVHMDDEKSLSHVPYIEEEAGDDADFVHELQQHYVDGIHGDTQTAGQFINDKMLFELIKILMGKYLDLGLGDSPPLPMCRAICSVFPNKCTFSKLHSQKWTDLVLKYKTEEDIRDTDSPNLCPNIDDPQSEVVGHERSLNSYAELICHRCFRYDCLLHNQHDGGSGPSSGPIKRKKQPNRNRNTPCSEECYLHDFILQKSGADRRLTVEVGSEKKRAKSSEKTEKWTNQETSLFHALRDAFGDDYCGIAKCMFKNKNCRQVRLFAHNQGLSSPTNDSQISPKSTKKKSQSYKAQVQRYRAAKWARGNGKVANDKHYEPCDHPGQDCNASNCSCEKCLKFCNCSDTCSNRFPGCKCNAGCKTERCECLKAFSECDPDICVCCGAADFSGAKPVSCRNVNIQRGWKQHLLMGESDVSGWGIFLKNSVQKNDFISEYCGERISQEEGERRGKIYDRKKCSYLFTLNDRYAVDATWKGNKIRFANHSVNPNCYARIMMVNGDQRIGIYAKRDIEAGEELFFDYSYDKQQRIEFVSVERGKEKK